MAPKIDFAPEKACCPVCNQPLKVSKTKRRKLATLVAGDFVGHESKYSCPRCNLTHSSEKLLSLVPPASKFGYDVLVYVGTSTFLSCRNAKQIVEKLKDRGINISRSEVGCLAAKFVVYLSLAHKRVQKKTKAFLHLHGGYVLHLDGTCEGGSPHLVSALDGITEIVLDNVKMPSESSDHLIAFLKGIKSSYGDPVAVVSDMASAIMLAVKEVFKGVANLLCHFHFLRDLGKDLFEQENDMIRKRLRKHGVQGLLRKRARKLEKLIASKPHLAHGFACVVEGGRLPADCPIEYIPAIATYTLILWTLAGKHQGEGRGFPFDQPYLVFYHRVQILDSTLRDLNRVRFTTHRRDYRIYSTIIHDLLGLPADLALRQAALRMEEKVGVFNKLRTAMRITVPETKRGLNDNGELSSMKTIEKEVRKFRDLLRKDNHFCQDPDYQKMVRQLEKYWEKLFSDPIVVRTKAGNRVIQPQRTNNILGQFFRDITRGYRRKSGCKSMEKTIKAMLADTPLVKNLEKKAYLPILLDSRSSLEQLFSDCDVQEVRDQLKRLKEESQTASAEIRKIIKNLDQPEMLITLFRRQHQNQNPPGAGAPTPPPKANAKTATAHSRRVV